MDGEHEKRVEEIFHEALKRKTPGEKTAFLKKACGGDADLLARAEELLCAHEEAGSFLSNLEPPGPGGERSSIQEGPGTKIGPYKLLQRIGEGGFGMVYMAEQIEPVRRRVALKIIKLGMDTKQVIARFEAERQALAIMDHHNIARVFDAGATDSGRPYFVMELVQGVPVTEYCDKANLSTKDRLKLFAQVCHAIHHAHQKGIIHRDIKPTNVMVTLHDGVPVPKVIDFGVAKAMDRTLTERTLFTEYGQVIGTPEYMSPEQAEMSGLDIDTRSDIYSLGALLYELLTGAKPLDVQSLLRAGYAELMRTIREVDPPRPSLRVSTLGRRIGVVAKQRQISPKLLSRLLKGEVDWIVMKALDKERSRRYSSADGLAADIESYLAHKPVAAGPPGVVYLMRKFLKRNQWRVAAACAAVLLLLVSGFSIYQYWQQAVKERERQAQETHAAKDRLYRNKVLKSVVKIAVGRPEPSQRHQDAIPKVLNGGTIPGGMLAATSMMVLDHSFPDSLEEAVADLEEAVGIFPERPDAYFHLARGFLRLGRKERARSALVNLVECDSGFGPALALQEELLEQKGARASTRAMMDGVDRKRESRWSKAWIEAYQAEKNKKWEEAEKAYDELIRLEQTGADPYLGFSIDTLMGRGMARLEGKDFYGALEDFAGVRARWPGLLEPGLHLGKTYYLIGEPEIAERTFQKLHDSSPFPNEACFGISKIYRDMREYEKTLEWLRKADESTRRENIRCVCLKKLGRTEEAVRAGRRAVELNPNNTFAHNNLGSALYKQGNVEAAMAEFRRALKLDPGYALGHTNLGAILGIQGKLEAAMAEYHKAIELDPNDARVHINLGFLLFEQGKPEAAMAEYRVAIELNPNYAEAHNSLGLILKNQGNLEAAAAEYHKAIEVDPNYAEAHICLGVVFFEKSKLEAAMAKFRRAIELDPNFAIAHFNLGNVLFKKGDLDEAVAEYRKAIALDPNLAIAHNNLGDALSEKGYHDETMAEYRKAIELDPNNADVHNNLGNALFKKGDLDEAVAKYRKAIELDPNHALAHNNLGVVLFEQGDIDAAMAKYRKAIELDPNNDLAHNNLGNALEKKGDHDAALAAYRRAIELDPNNVLAHSNLGTALSDQGKIEAAIDEYRKAIDLDSNYALVHYNLGAVLMMAGRYKEAIIQYKKAIRFGYKTHGVYCSLGAVLTMEGELEEAVPVLRRAIEFLPGSLIGRVLLIYALEKQGKLEQAVEAVKADIECVPEDAAAHFILGLYLQGLGHIEDAIKEYCKVLELNPSFDYLKGLSFIFYGLGKYEEAFAAGRKALTHNHQDIGIYKSLIEMLGKQDEFWCPSQLDNLAATLEKILAENTPNDCLAMEALALTLICDSPAKNREKAQRYARLAVKETKGKDADALLVLAQVQFSYEKQKEAVLTLEKALKIPEANLSHKRKLEAYRRSVSPRLFSYSSVEAALLRREMLIPEDAAWRFFRGLREPSESLLWTALDFDDGAWEEGTSGFGSRASIVPRVGTLLLDMTGSYSTFYMRHVFRLEDPSSYKRLRLILYVNDGFIAYLNGQEVARLYTGPSGTLVPYNGSATQDIGTEVPFEFWIDARLLKPGNNCLALQVLDVAEYGVPTDLYVMPSLEAEAEYDARKDRELYDRFTVVAGDENEERMRAYLKGRMLQRAGKQEEALAKFETLLDSDNTQPEPYLRIVESLRAIGDSDEAEARLSEAIEAGILAREDI